MMAGWKLRYAWWPTQMTNGRWMLGGWYVERDGERRRDFWRG